MYCHNCGKTLFENADFCGHCGAKTIINEALIQEAPIAIIARDTEDDEAIVTSDEVNNSDINRILSKITLVCTKIINISFDTNGTILNGMVFKYIVGIETGHIIIKEKLSSFFEFIEKIMYVLGVIVGVIAGERIATAIGTSPYSQIDNNEIIIWFALCLLVIGLYSLIVYCILGRNEKKAVVSSINSLLESENVNVPILCEKKKGNKTNVIVSLSCILISIVLFVLFHFANSSSNIAQAQSEWYTPIPAISVSSATDIAKTEDLSKIELGQTYINVDEGFSFNYPVGWTIAAMSELEDTDIVFIYNTRAYDDYYYVRT